MTLALYVGWYDVDVEKKARQSPPLDGHTPTRWSSK
jgi:hypothetical protein